MACLICTATRRHRAPPGQPVSLKTSPQIQMQIPPAPLLVAPSAALHVQLKRVSDSEDWSHMKQDPSTVGSNVYTVGEGLLLKWLTVHRQAIYDPLDEPAPPGKVKEDTRIINFGSDLMDGKAFAAVLQCFAPPLERRFDHTVDGGFRLHPEEREDYEHNMGIVLNAVKSIGLNTPFTPRDMLDFNQVPKGVRAGMHWKGRGLRGGPRGGYTGGWRRLSKRLGAVTVGYKCH